MKKTDKKIIFALLLIFILAASLRILYLDKPFQRDEVVFFETAEDVVANGSPVYCKYCVDEHGRMLKIFDAHTPFSFLMIAPFVQFFGLNEAVIRAPFVIFSLLTIVLIYFLGKDLGGARLGLLAAFLLAITRLHVEFAQVVDIDGSLLTFFMLLTMYLLFKWWKFKKPQLFAMFVASFVIAFLIKEAMFLFLFALFLYYAILERRSKGMKKFLAIFIIVSSIFAASLFAISYIYKTDYLDGIFRTSTRFAFQRASTNAFQRLYQYVGINTWGFTAPLVVLAIISLLHAWRTKNNFYRLMVITTLVFVLFYTLVLGLNRYFIPIIPILCLLIANYLISLKIKLKSSTIACISISIVAVMIAFYSLGMRTDLIFLNNIRSHAYLIILPYALTALPVLLLVLRKKSAAIILLVALTIAFNLYFAIESLNPLAAPNYYRAVADASNFIKSKNLDKLATMNDIGYYAKRDYYNLEFPEMTVEHIAALVKEGRLKNFLVRTNSILMQPGVYEYLQNNCKKIGSSLSKGTEIFAAYSC
jgi:4-amino-4-deoxy-L-arabinose transferase-like glycosyltransferase